MTFKTARWVVGIVAAIMVIGGIAWSYTVWYECRISGYSFAYCAKMIAR